MARQAQELRPVPIGIEATGKRKETDSMGEIEFPANHYWGAQTERSLIHFAIGDDHMPKQVYRAYGYVKRAAAEVNVAAGRLDRWQSCCDCGSDGARRPDEHGTGSGYCRFRPRCC